MFQALDTALVDVGGSFWERKELLYHDNKWLYSLILPPSENISPLLLRGFQESQDVWYNGDSGFLVDARSNWAQVALVDKQTLVSPQIEVQRGEVGAHLDLLADDGQVRCLNHEMAKDALLFSYLLHSSSHHKCFALMPYIVNTYIAFSEIWTYTFWTEAALAVIDLVPKHRTFDPTKTVFTQIKRDHSKELQCYNVYTSSVYLQRGRKWCCRSSRKQK